MREKHARAVIKAVTYRGLGTLVTISVVYAFTGQLALSVGVGAVEVLSKMLFYYIHERLWERIPWGKAKHPLSDLPVKRELAPGDMTEIKQRLRELGYL